MLTPSELPVIWFRDKLAASCGALTPCTQTSHFSALTTLNNAILAVLAVLAWLRGLVSLPAPFPPFCPGAALLLVMSYYIPTTYSHTLTWEINAGRTEAATLRLVGGA